ncbi:DUF2452 domain-containing protein [Roseivirga sp. BDSF3-8]|uniref:DUF2452 domain-containing protein n=1 Tax=Roseivirga sp. BDSF3-8 TaxID=3241598 RepID=UPI0035319AD9
MEKGKKIDVDKIDLEEMAEKATQNPGTIAFPHHSGSAMIKPEDKGKLKGRAVSAMEQQTDRQLKQLYEQMQLLAGQAKELQVRKEMSERIYLAEMNFEPLIGHQYHLYQKKDKTDVLSMVGPNEWGRKKPYEAFLATVELLADHTWEIKEKGSDFE